MAIETNTNFILQSIEGDGTRGGWRATGSFANDQDEAVFSRRVELYMTLEGGGEWESQMLAMRGSILPRSTRFDIRQSSTEVTIATSDNFLSSAGLQGIYFTDPAVTTHPHEYTDLRLGTMVKHIIEQHTNISSTGVLQNADGTFSATSIGGWVDTSGIDVIFSTKVDVYTVRQSNSLWRTLKDIARNEFYVVYMTKKDEFIYDIHPVFKATLDPITLAIDADMIVGQPEIVYRNREDVDQVVLSALTDDGDIIRSQYPTNITAPGRRKNITNLRCNDTNRLDTLAQRVFSFDTRTYDLRIALPGAWGLYLELFDRVSFTYSGTARNGVSLTFSAEPFFIEKIRVSRSGSFGAITELELQQENLVGVLYA